MAEADSIRMCDRCDAPIEASLTRGRPRKRCLSCSPPVQGVTYIPRTGGTKICRHEPCRAAFHARHMGVGYCSKTCKAAATKALNQAVCESRRVRGPRCCANVDCKRSFTPEYGNKQHLYCTPECSQLAYRRRRSGTGHKRRAKRYGAPYQYIDPIRVMQRDGWVCQICKAHLNQKDRGSIKPEAPELGHIVALARGGAHAWHNVQCECRRCNAVKGVKTYPMAA